MIETKSLQSVNSYPNISSKYLTYPNADLSQKTDVAEISKKTTDIQEKTEEKKKSSKKALIAGISLAGAAIITLLGVLTKARGLNKKIQDILKKNIDVADRENILNFTRLKEHINFSAKEGRALKISNFLNNTANFKDCYLLPFLNKIPFLRGFAQKTSKVYTDTGISMTQAAYKHTNTSYGIFDKKLSELIASKPSREIQELIEKRNSLISEHFTPQNIPQRAKQIEQIMDNVGEKGICITVRDTFTNLIKKALTKRDISGFGEFIAEDMVKTQKANYIDALRKTRDAILEMDDKIIELLKNGIDEKTYNNLITARTNAQKSLNNAIRTEGNDLFDKIRDIKIGSAPNDILGMIGTTGMLGIYLAQAEDKNQRVEAALTTGLPLGLGMLSTTFATMKMFTGIKAIGFGAITTFIANTIGKVINKEYQKRHNIKHQELEIPTLDKTVEGLKDKIVPQEHS